MVKMLTCLSVLVSFILVGCTGPLVRQVDPQSLEGRTILDIGHANGHILYLVPKAASKD